jgi:hypothetical protein
MLPSDLALLEDEKFLVWVKKYRDDEQLFFKDFAKAFQKVVCTLCACAAELVTVARVGREEVRSGSEQRQRRRAWLDRGACAQASTLRLLWGGGLLLRSRRCSGTSSGEPHEDERRESAILKGRIWMRCAFSQICARTGPATATAVPPARTPARSQAHTRRRCARAARARVLRLRAARASLPTRHAACRRHKASRL